MDARSVRDLLGLFVDHSTPFACHSPQFRERQELPRDICIFILPQKSELNVTQDVHRVCCSNLACARVYLGFGSPLGGINALYILLAVFHACVTIIKLADAGFGLSLALGTCKIKSATIRTRYRVRVVLYSIELYTQAQPDEHSVAYLTTLTLKATILNWFGG